MRSSVALGLVAIVGSGACSYGGNGGEGPATPHCTRTLIDVRATSGTVHGSTGGAPTQTIPLSTCSGGLTSTLNEDDGSISDIVAVSCGDFQFSALIPDVRSLSGSNSQGGSLHVSGSTDCYLPVTISIDVTSSRGGAAPMPAVVTSDFVRDFTISGATDVDDSCVKASWSMTASFVLTSGNVRWGTELCFTPV